MYFAMKNINVMKYKLVIVALIYPLINLYYNHIKNPEINKKKKYRDSKYMEWLFDRIHNNSLYIATGVFALNGITQKLIGKNYKKIIPYYAATIFFGVCVNLAIFFSSSEYDDDLIAKFKSISLTYGIAFMSIGIFYTIQLFS